MNNRIRPSEDLISCEYSLQPFFELAAELGPCDERSHVEPEQGALTQPLRDVPADDPLRQALDDRRLADARVADQDRVVLGLAREDLDHAADLGVASDHRVEAAGARLDHEIASVLLQGLVGRLGCRARDPLAATDLGQRLEEAIPREPRLAEGAIGLCVEHCQHDVLNRDVLILQALGLLLGRVQDEVERAREVDLGGRARPADLRPGRQPRLDLRRDRRRADAHPLEHRRHEPVGLFDERGKHVIGVDLGMPVAERQRLRGRERFLGLLRQPIGVHRFASSRSIRASSSDARIAPA